MKAIKTPALGVAKLVDDVPVPLVAHLPGFVLLKTIYVAVNPCDYGFADMPFMFQQDITIGAEVCGEVVALHPDASSFKRPVKIGDRLAGCVFPTNPSMPDGGAHAEYVLVKADAMLRVEELGDRDDPTLEQRAVALGIATITVFIGLYWEMSLPLPELGREGTRVEKRDVLFVYGGSTCTGMQVIQWAKISGLTVLTTCSPGNFDLVKGLGADEVFDYHDADKCIQDVQASMSKRGQELKLVFDCIGIFDAQKICAGVLAPGGVYNSIVSMELPGREDVQKIFTAGEKAIGEPFVMASQTIPVENGMLAEFVRFAQLAERYFREGKLRFNPVSLSRGWESVLEKMQELRDWKTSATKNICSIASDA